MIQPQMRRRTPMLRTLDHQRRSFGEESDLSFEDVRARNQRVVKVVPPMNTCAQYICLGHPHKRRERICQIQIFLSLGARAHEATVFGLHKSSLTHSSAYMRT
eukprot:TRINITY_DN6747_c0_g3_i3.p1 TRINITY_DN6747_c0_g3~~TRINITY_DN6747_c0_g3_i3.p1  ORF type:complete len:103 (+),score=9.01 TRINITY_DN6747_c0_g3_i3:199-507(+)